MMSSEIADLVDLIILRALEDELGIVLPKKSSATKNYAPKGETIGCRYDAAKVVSHRARPIGLGLVGTIL